MEHGRQMENCRVPGTRTGSRAAKRKDDCRKPQASGRRDRKDQSKEVGIKINQSTNKGVSCKIKFAVEFKKIVSRVPSRRKRPRSPVPATWRQPSVPSPLLPS